MEQLSIKVIVCGLMVALEREDVNPPRLAQCGNAVLSNLPGRNIFLFPICDGL